MSKDVRVGNGSDVESDDEIDDAEMMNEVRIDIL